MAPISKAQIKLIRSLQHKKFRDELGLFVAEGQKCIDELKKGFELVMEVTPENATEAEIAQMSGLKTPQGVIAVFKKKIINQKSQITNGELMLALDGIQDPGNLGTIIRTCDWFGVKNIVCSNDTADCYNPKVVQATMGALTRVQLTYTDLAPFLQEAKKKAPTSSAPCLMAKICTTNSPLSTLHSPLSSSWATKETASHKWFVNSSHTLYVFLPIRRKQRPQRASTSPSLRLSFSPSSADLDNFRLNVMR